MIHECKQEEVIGKFKEFMQTTKGMRATLLTISIAIILQVGTFLFLWGSLTTTVKQNTEYLWKDITPRTTENTRNIDKILAKFELIQVIKGATGDKGERGANGQSR